MRELSYKSHRVNEKRFPSVRKSKTSRRGVKSCKEFVFCQDVAFAQPVHKSGFSRVGISHQRDGGYGVPCPAFPERISSLFHILKLCFKEAYSSLYMPSVNLQFFLTRTSCSYTASEP